MKKLISLLCLLLCLTLAAGDASAISMKKGSRGMDQFYLQMRLRHLGYDQVGNDGTYDAAVAEAVKDFQGKHGLKATGAVNNDTWAALFTDSYYLMYSLGMSARTYTVHGRLAPPFTRVEVPDNPNGYDSTANMYAEDIYAQVILLKRDSLDKLVQEEQDAVKKVFDETFAVSYEGKNFKKSADKKIKINGKPARLMDFTWNFNNEGKLNHYTFEGMMELDKVDGVQILALVELSYNIPPEAKLIAKALGSDAVKAILEGLRCNRDRLTDYQAGAAKRKKASKLKVKLPEFQPIEENQQDTLDILYALRDYGDPAADGSSGEMDGASCVNLYYGVKIMQRYRYFVDAGNKPQDAMAESTMALANGIFDHGLREDFPQVREKLNAALTAAKLALTEEGKPYLTLLGLDAPAWTAEELEEMQRRLVGAMDRVINQ